VVPLENFDLINCPLCSSAQCKELKKSTYPPSLTASELINIYKSSSDNKLYERVVKCSNCSLVYLNPRLKSEAIISSYENGIDEAFALQNDMRIRTFTNSLKWILSSLKYNSNSKKVNILDIGCAGGAFLKAGKDLNLNMTGIEPSKYLSKFATEKYGVKVHQGTLENYPISDEKIDIITMWDVIEHLTDPSSILKNIHGRLSDDGALVVNYPDYSSLTAKLLGWKWPFWLSVHLIYFDKNTIKQILENNGFKILSVKKHWQTLELGYLLQRASAYFSFFRFFQKLSVLLKIDKTPMKYYLGQIQVISKKMQSDD